MASNSRILEYFGLLLLAGSSAVSIPAYAQELTGETPSAEQIVAQCRHNPNATTGRTIINFTIENMSGSATKERTVVMFWKIVNEKNVYARQTMFVTDPPAFQFNAYLRWEPPASSSKPPDQWIYSTKQQRTRRIATRDPDDLTWGLIGEDLKLLQWPASTKTLLKSWGEQNRQFYEIEIVPTAEKSIYGKIVARYERGADWSSCVHTRAEFFDREEELTKDITTTWGWLGPNRIRKSIVVTSTKSKTKTSYRFQDTVLDPELDDAIFTSRALAYAERYLNQGAPQPEP